MATKNPLGKIKDLTKGAASVGLRVAGQATKQATSLTAGAVSKLVQGKRLPVAPAPEPQAPEAQAPAKKAPSEKAPAPARKPAQKATPPKAAPAPAAEPITSIDAAADVEHVDVTPADVAKKMARKAPAHPAGKKAPAKKTTPGAKLPPRKKVEEPQAADSTSGSDRG